MFNMYTKVKNKKKATTNIKINTKNKNNNKSSQIKKLCKIKLRMYY